MKTNKKTSTKSERNCYKPYDDIRICNLDEIGISNLETRKTGNLNSTDCVTDDDLFKRKYQEIPSIFVKEPKKRIRPLCC